MHPCPIALAAAVAYSDLPPRCGFCPRPAPRRPTSRRSSRIEADVRQLRRSARYRKRGKDGITLGFSQNPPEVFQDEKTKQPAGIDWDINKAVLDWMGVKKIKLVWMPWESQVPALLSKRIDVIAGNIHHTAERDKVISFSGPAYWYGPVMIVPRATRWRSQLRRLEGQEGRLDLGLRRRLLSAPDRRDDDAVQDRDR